MCVLALVCVFVCAMVSLFDTTLDSGMGIGLEKNIDIMYMAVVHSTALMLLFCISISRCLRLVCDHIHLPFQYA